MKISKKFVSLTAIASAAFLLANGAQAQTAEFVNPEWANNAWYIGAGIGKTDANLDDSNIIREYSSAATTVNSFRKDEKDSGYKLFFGKQMGRYFAAEFGYTDLGKYNYRVGSLQGNTAGADISYKGVNLDLLGFVPFTERFSAYGRIGATYLKARNDFSGNLNAGRIDTDRKRGNPKVGLGLEYKFTEALALRGEAERHYVDDSFRRNGKVDMYSLALVYKYTSWAAQQLRQ
jgi:OmpA-OmpF porin, OOP family